jgi:hypothetical protein
MDYLISVQAYYFIYNVTFQCITFSNYTCSLPGQYLVDQLVIEENFLYEAC